LHNAETAGQIVVATINSIASVAVATFLVATLRRFPAAGRGITGFVVGHLAI
jgi:hypothetical protein